jgi:hypothetical protein
MDLRLHALWHDVTPTHNLLRDSVDRPTIRKNNSRVDGGRFDRCYCLLVLVHVSELRIWLWGVRKFRAGR